MGKILWGGATSASQYEGRWDYQEGWDTQDCRPYLPRTETSTTKTRLLSNSDLKDAQNSSDFFPFRVGSKGIQHLEEDLILLLELGIDIYRLSISWSRLFPDNNDSEPSPEGLAYYDKIISFLNHHGIKIFLTMNHYALPLRFINQYGGWQNREVISEYLKLAKTIFSHWGDKIDYYLPFNEINAGYFSPFNGLGVLREQGCYDYQEIFQALHHQFIASAQAIELGRCMGVKGRFGCMIACFCYYPLTPRPEDNLRLVREEQVNQWFCMDVLAHGRYPYYMQGFFQQHNVQLTFLPEDLQLLRENTADFVSFSYYSSSICTIDETSEQLAGNLVVTQKNPYLQASDWGWQIDPIGLRTTLHKVYDRYQKPVIISENGLGAHDTLTEEKQIHDDYRIQYFKEHFKEILESEKENVPIEAYMAWGIIDLVSAGSCEMEKRYGVVYVDADNYGKGTYNRYKKDSYYWYQEFLERQKAMRNLS